MYKQEFNRVLSLKHLLVYGLVLMSPLAPFQVYGMVAKESFGMVPLVYVIGTIVMLFTAMSYSRMSNVFPYAGSVYSYVQRGLNSHVGFIAGWNILSDYILAPALIYMFAGLWMTGIFPDIPPYLWSLLFILITSVVNALGISLSARVNMGMFWLQIAALVIFLTLSIKFVFVDGHGTGGFSVTSLFQGDVFDFNFIAASISIAVLGFIGFDGISTLSEEAKNPQKDIGRATVLSVVMVGVLFFVQSYMATLVHPNFENLDNDMALFDISKEIGGQWFYVTMIIVNVLSVGIAVTLNLQTAVARILYSISRDGLLPGSKFLSKVHSKYKTPINSILFSGVISLIVLFTLSIETIVRFVNFGAVTSFMFLNITVIYYFIFKKKQRSLKALIIYLLFPLIGFATTLFVWTGFDKMTYMYGFGWLLVGLIIGAVQSKGYKKEITFKDM